jgi:hypothetical protein
MMINVFIIASILSGAVLFAAESKEAKQSPASESEIASSACGLLATTPDRHLP